jgi:hypothetical protein
MKALLALLPVLVLGRAFAADLPAKPVAERSNGTAHRYLVESTSAPGTLAGLKESIKAKTGANAALGVHWLRSYANSDETKIFSVYEGPNEAIVRQAAALRAVSIDGVAEVPVDLDPGIPSNANELAAGQHRFLIKRTFPAGALDGLDAATKAKVNGNNSTAGVQWVTSYANEGKTKTYCIYNGASEAAIRSAAKANGLPVDSITEVPVTLAPK